MQIGDWVKLRRSTRVGIVRNMEGNQKFVDWRLEDGKPIGFMARAWVNNRDLVLAPLDITDEDALAMIDLALDLKDFEWAKELFAWYIEK